MKITSEFLKEKGACNSGYDWFTENFKKGSEIRPLFERLCVEKKDDWANWILFRIAGQNDFSACLRFWINLCIKRDTASSTAGNYAHSSTAGFKAHSSTAGNYAHSSTAGDYAHSSTAGKNSIAACLGLASKAKAGENGAVIVGWWDDKAERPRVTVGYIGENDIKADTWYRTDETGALVEAA